MDSQTVMQVFAGIWLIMHAAEWSYRRDKRTNAYLVIANIFMVGSLIVREIN